VVRIDGNPSNVVSSPEGDSKRVFLRLPGTAVPGYSFYRPFGACDAPDGMSALHLVAAGEEGRGKPRPCKCFRSTVANHSLKEVVAINAVVSAAA